MAGAHLMIDSPTDRDARWRPAATLAAMVESGPGLPRRWTAEPKIHPNT
ncbi:MAG: hypothetical protein ACRDT6_14625 [Micromonosporaceae bacterium]